MTYSPYKIYIKYALYKRYVTYAKYVLYRITSHKRYYGKCRFYMRNKSNSNKVLILTTWLHRVTPRQTKSPLSSRMAGSLSLHGHNTPR